MQFYDILQKSNDQIYHILGDMDKIDPNDGLKRNMCFKRLQETLLHITDVKKHCFYNPLKRYPLAYSEVRKAQYMYVQLAGMLDALSREVISSEIWEEKFTTLKQWIDKVITLEEDIIIPLAKCYFTPEDEERLLQDMAVETHVLDHNQAIEDKVEAEYQADYVHYKKAPDTPGKSHLPPKRWRMGSV